MAEISVKKNTLFNVVKSVFGIIYPLITFPYISRVLLTENVGRINFGNSIISYYSLIATLGVATYAVRECSKYKGDKKQLGKVASQIFSINICSTVIAYVALVVTLLFARPLDNYRLLIIIQSSTIMFTTLGADWINTAMEDFRFIAVRTMVMQIVSIILMFVFVKKPEDYLIYAGISVIASSGANIINIFYRKKYCKIFFTMNMEIKKHLPSVILLFSIILSQTIYTSSGTTILGLFKGDFQVGLYSTSIKLYTIVNTIVASVTWVVMPQLSKAFSEKCYEKVNELLKYALNYIVVLGLPCLVGLNVITEEIIILIAGEEYLGAVLSLKILTIALGCSFISGWIGNLIMIPSERENVSLKSSAISATVNIVLNLILIPIWGLNAAALTTAISEALGIIIKYPYIEKDIRIDNLKQILRTPIVGVMSIIVVSFVVKYFFSSAYLIAILTIVLGALVYLLTLILMKNEFTLSFLKSIAQRLKRR